MEYIKINKLFLKRLGLYFIIILGFLLNNNIVFAGFGDDNDLTEKDLPPGCSSVSRNEKDYKDERGFYKINNQFRNDNGDLENNVIYYYKAATIQEKYIDDKLKDSNNVYTVYLYFLTNNEFDKEIAKEVAKRKKDVVINEFYN